LCSEVAGTILSSLYKFYQTFMMKLKEFYHDETKNFNDKNQVKISARLSKSEWAV
jgi:hypothetical protein